MAWPDNSLAYIHSHFKFPYHLSKPDHDLVNCTLLNSLVFIYFMLFTFVWPLSTLTWFTWFVTTMGQSTMIKFNWYWMTTMGYLAHWPPSDSAHLVCVCDCYWPEYKDWIDHLVCFQATSLPSKASQSTTHAMLKCSVHGSLLVYWYKRTKTKN